MSDTGYGDDKSVDTLSNSTLLELTADIVASYVANNTVDKEDVSGVVKTVYGTLTALNAGTAPQSAPEQKPAVPVKRSVHPDYIVCLEDGKKLKMLKRHLRTAYGMTPEDYRAKWGLPSDYPMVAPNYAKQRSAFAKQIGLGKK